MAKTTRSAATERAYLHFMRAPLGGAAVVGPVAAAAAGDEDFDEADIWGMFAPIAEAAPRARQLVAARKALASAAKPAAAADGGGRPAHGSLPVKIPDWSKILGHEYRPGGGGDWEMDDEEDSVEAAALVPPHELVWRRRRAASLSLSSLNYGGVGRTLKVRDAVWKRTTGFQD